MVGDYTEREHVEILIDGVKHRVPERITVKKAMELSGTSFCSFPGDGDIFSPCETGGCFSCSVRIDGDIKRSCVTQIADDTAIQTTLPAGHTPLRIVHGPQPHSVGGKATPWRLKRVQGYVEVAIWTSGCNLSCPQCQNYMTTYDGRSKPLTPEEAAKLVTRARRRYGVNRMAISGGEPTLNMNWLIGYFKALKKLNSDQDARLHLDSNGTVLTEDHVDDLVEEAFVTDIGIEPKGLDVETFMRITAVRRRRLAEKYLRTSWNAIKYVMNNYSDKVFLGVGLPYNKAFISLEEVGRFGERLASIDPDIQLCVLDYFPTFRRTDIRRPSLREMLNVKRTLEAEGLTTVVVQTSIGQIGPNRKHH